MNLLHPKTLLNKTFQKNTTYLLKLMLRTNLKLKG